MYNYCSKELTLEAGVAKIYKAINALTHWAYLHIKATSHAHVTITYYLQLASPSQKALLSLGHTAVVARHV